ncbi:unnamed protein product [Rotaria magnacalcarata]|uniref:CCHC-type domain-containing protein n=2 Tax=Rotaria magnacalcarata TaxID=392030 RepID=A0A817A399_9BILA|nr:unnamed protein product [Rotaria magnacalcarata]
MGAIPQQPVIWSDRNISGYGLVNNIACNTNNEAISEPHLMYYTFPVNPSTNDAGQARIYYQQQANVHPLNQFTPTNSIMHPHYLQQQCSSLNSNVLACIQEPLIHTNTSRKEIFRPVEQQILNLADIPQTTMNNPTVSSTPISNSIKRGRNDVSGISESNMQLQNQHSNINQVLNANNIPAKRLRGMNQSFNQLVENPLEPSSEACRFAATRYSFSPFSIIFKQDVRDKLVVEDLTKHILENCSFELKLLAFRRARDDKDERKILVFVENSESFLILYNQENWPTTLASSSYTTKKPSIPPQLSLVIPNVSLQTNWEDFVQDLQDNYPSISNVIRLRNKAQQPLRAVKLEFSSSITRKEILEAGEIAALHIKYKVVEFFTQANVLICSNCYGIGHFRKNCAQKSEATCKTCSEKCNNLKDRVCSGILKCVHCGDAHSSNDTKCKVIQNYRSALTRNILSKRITENTESIKPGRMISNTHLVCPTTADGLSYANVVKGSSFISNDILLKKLDSIITKVEEESNATRQSLDEIKQEMRSRQEETKQQVEALEEKVKVMEKKSTDFSTKMGKIIQNICSTLLAPQCSQGQQWKSYWQEQIKTLEEARSSFAKPS